MRNRPDEEYTIGAPFGLCFDEETGGMLSCGTFVYPDTGEPKESGAFEDLNVVVLTNGKSASASEILAGTLRDWGRERWNFVVVGTQTYGKGVGQSIFNLSDGSEFWLTTFEFLVGNSRTSIHETGVVPNYLVRDTRRMGDGAPDDTATERDAQFQYALHLFENNLIGTN